MNGSLELLVGDDSRGLVVASLEPEGVPTIAGAVWGLADITPVETPRAGTQGEWTAMAPGLVEARLIYWPPSPERPVYVDEVE